MKSTSRWEITPFKLPLDRDALQRALQLGHGRALMHANRYGITGWEDLLIDACVHNKCYDAQCEDSRAPWLAEIIATAGVESAFIDNLISAMRNAGESDTFWDKGQCCELAAHFAKMGNPQARELLYASLRKHPSTHDLIGAEEIIDLDGADGLIFVAQKAGAWLIESPETEIGDYPLKWYDERHEAGQAEKILELAAAADHRVAAYLKHVRRLRGADDDRVLRGGGTIKPDLMRFADRPASRADAIENWSARKIIREIEEVDPAQNKRGYGYTVWARKANQVDLAVIADKMFSELDARRVRIYLWVFAKGLLQPFDRRFLKLIEHDDDMVRWRAMGILSEYVHPDVRALAVQFARAGKNDQREIQLFEVNYQPGDWRLIEENFQLPTDRDHLHRVLSDLTSIYEKNSHDEAREPMILAYEHNPCANCRRDAVEVLQQNRLTPDWILKECQFDADQGTRKLVNGIESE